MIIPNKSTIAEEEIEVPFGGREGRESSSTAMDDRDRGGDRGIDTDGEAERDPESDYRSPRSPFGGLSGLSARLGRDTDDDDPGPARGGGDDYYDKMSVGRASVASDRSGGGGPGSRLNPNNSANIYNTSRSGSAAGGGLGAEEQEKMRRDYEFRIATMQSKIQGLEREVGGAGGQRERERKWEDGEERVRSMEEELNGLRRVREQPRISYAWSLTSLLLL